MTYNLRYLDHSYEYQSWIFQARSLEVAEAIACAYCNERGFTFADIEILELI